MQKLSILVIVLLLMSACSGTKSNEVGVSPGNSNAFSDSTNAFPEFDVNASGSGFETDSGVESNQEVLGYDLPEGREIQDWDLWDFNKSVIQKFQVGMPKAEVFKLLETTEDPYYFVTRDTGYTYSYEWNAAYSNQLTFNIEFDETVGLVKWEHKKPSFKELHLSPSVIDIELAKTFYKSFNDAYGRTDTDFNWYITYEELVDLIGTDGFFVGRSELDGDYIITWMWFADSGRTMDDGTPRFVEFSVKWINDKVYTMFFDRD